MKILRRVVLPTVFGTPLCLWANGIWFSGMSALSDFYFRPVDLLFIGFFVLAGLLVVGLPSALWLLHFNVRPILRPPALLTTGILGGGLLTAAPLLNLAGAIYGVVPGATVAIVWMVLNADLIVARSREAHV